MHKGLAVQELNKEVSEQVKQDKLDYRLEQLGEMEEYECRVDGSEGGAMIISRSP